VLAVLDVPEVLDVLLVPSREIPSFDKASVNAFIKPPPFSPFGGGGGLCPSWPLTCWLLDVLLV